MISDGMIIIAGTIVTMILSFVVGVKTRYKPYIQPRNGAFKIWFIIFVALNVSGGVLALSEESQVLPSVLCLSSLLLCSSWLFIATTKYSVYVLLSACACACASSILYKHANTLESSLVLLGPNLLCSWLTIAGALSLIIHLKESPISEEWIALPFLLLNIGISIANVMLGSYFGSACIAFPVIWTAFFSDSSNIWLFLATGLVEIGFLLGHAFHCSR